MVGGGREGLVVGKFCENWEADDPEAWENGRSQHELLATVWVMGRITEMVSFGQV